MLRQLVVEGAHRFSVVERRVAMFEHFELRGGTKGGHVGSVGWRRPVKC